MPQAYYQPTPDSPSVQQLRRSGRDPVPSTKYPPHEYVLMTDAGEKAAVSPAGLIRLS